MQKGYILSLESDAWLFHADLLVDKAHVVMLEERGIISSEDAAAILNGLAKIAARGRDFVERELPAYEDVHTAVESVLIREIGEEVGGRMHTGRSRNDEVATCIRIAVRDELLGLAEEVNKLRRALLKRAGENVETVLPGYTHLQHAQPTTLAHHLLAHADAFARDFARLEDAYGRVNACPLGAAAFASTGFPIDRERTAELLGFDAVLENSMDAVSTRDFVVETVSCYANLGTNLSRLAEEVILWSSAEFGFVRLPADYATGSSIMPQKRNPDYAELVRARAGTVFGCLVAVLSICKALPYAYNRDLQEVTPHLLRAAKTTAASVAVVRGVVAGQEFREEEMRRQAEVDFTTATELADTLVRETGVPFRTAHKIVASLASAERGRPSLRKIDEFATCVAGKRLSELGLTEEKVKEALEIASNIEKREVKGGPAKKEVLRMLQARRSDLEVDERSRVAKEVKVKRRLEELEREVEKKRIMP